MNLLFDVSLPRRIALWCMVALSSTGFSLCGLSCGQAAVHRLKPVLLDRAGLVLLPLAIKPARNFHRVLVRDADCFALKSY
jgi:hypothetical protein